MIRSVLYKNDDKCKIYFNETVIESQMCHAIVVSSTISDIYVGNPSTREFRFNLTISNESALDSLIKIFTTGEYSKEYPEVVIKELFDVGEYLGIDQFIEPYIKYLDKKTISRENFLEKTKIQEKYGNPESCYAFIANNFYSLQSNDRFAFFSAKSPQFIKSFLKERTIIAYSYDDLIDLALQLAEFNIEYFELFELLEIHRVSITELEKFEAFVLKLLEKSEIFKTLWAFIKPKIYGEIPTSILRIYSPSKTSFGECGFGGTGFGGAYSGIGTGFAFGSSTGTTSTFKKSTTDSTSSTKTSSFSSTSKTGPLGGAAVGKK